jgi:hypothetical protein
MMQCNLGGMRSIRRRGNVPAAGPGCCAVGCVEIGCRPGLIASSDWVAAVAWRQGSRATMNISAAPKTIYSATASDENRYGEQALLQDNADYCLNGSVQ